MYKAIGNKVVNRREVQQSTGIWFEEFDVCLCDEPKHAIALLSRASHENTKGHYTASARLNYAVTQLPGYAELESTTTREGMV